MPSASWVNWCLRRFWIIFFRMIFSDGSTKEGPFKTTQLRGKIWGEDIFKHFYATVLEINIAIEQLTSIITDIAPSMTSENIGFIWLCKKQSALHFLSLNIVLLLRGLYVHKWSISTYNGVHKKDQLLQMYIKERKKWLNCAWSCLEGYSIPSLNYLVVCRQNGGRTVDYI
jgi:hypothetical protein